MSQVLMILLLAMGAHHSSALGLPELNPVVVAQQDTKSISSVRLYLTELVKPLNQIEFQGDGTAERLAECLFPKTKEGGTREC